MKLVFRALVKFFAGFFLVTAMLFLPAGDLRYSNGWVFLGLLFIPMLILGIILLLKSPQLLKKRLEAKETENEQKIVVGISGLIFVVGFVIAGLDYRFGWSSVPSWGVGVASGVLLLSYGLYAEVMRENAYLSRTVAVQDDQKLVDSGLYGIVRHPMYAASVFLFLSIPIVLGSWWSFLCFTPYIGVMVMRIRNEEKVLTAGLAGYCDYQKRVKYRLYPGIW